MMDVDHVPPTRAQESEYLIQHSFSVNDFGFGRVQQMQDASIRPVCGNPHADV